MYPLKAGWQQLPEFEIKYNTPEDVVPERRADEQLNNIELQKLVDRWMPKKVFILVSKNQINDQVKTRPNTNDLSFIFTYFFFVYYCSRW